MYLSTRGGSKPISAATAIKAGIAGDGGLFVPDQIPKLSAAEIETLIPLDYQGRAVTILERFLADYSRREIEDAVRAAYTNDKFDDPGVAPVVSISDEIHVLELWHGPTSAFKDMALQLLPQLLSQALVKTGETRDIVILVATSGDTGKAALEGFKDVPKIKIIVFFPDQGVSEIQRLQMITQEGQNVAVVGVKGNFDDAQTGVKKIFNDGEMIAELDKQGYKLSSANSINWGRLVPQIIYYFSAYLDLVKLGRIDLGQPLNYVVPTGNFGNILAGYYAKLMGLPVGKLICASNSNNVLTEFLTTGKYDRVRPFHQTLSPSMDILISSNLERLLYHITDGDKLAVKQWMEQLQTSGSYRVDPETMRKLKETFAAKWVDDRQTKNKIGEIYSKYKYLIDPHTAVAWQAADQYRQESGDTMPIVIVSTASPFKFNESVLSAISGENLDSKSEFLMLDKLSRRSGWPVPKNLAQLEAKPVLHRMKCEKEEMTVAVKQILNYFAKG
ncbi:MAG: threonine synthase [Negativicutes bacterium]|nr:threonine synthase [Negativicutes bacterium]